MTSRENRETMIALYVLREEPMTLPIRRFPRLTVLAASLLLAACGSLSLSDEDIVDARAKAAPLALRDAELSRQALAATMAHCAAAWQARRISGHGATEWCLRDQLRRSLIATGAAADRSLIRDYIDRRQQIADDVDRGLLSPAAAAAEVARATARLAANQAEEDRIIARVEWRKGAPGQPPGNPYAPVAAATLALLSGPPPH
jgi:hypothetical protein